MAIAQQLRYRPNARHGDEAWKVFAGHPVDFSNWEFNMKITAKAADKDHEKATKYVKETLAGLSGEAYQLAKNIGPEKLLEKEGLTYLVDEMRKFVFPTWKQETKELYAIGLEKGGILSRQHGEPMTSYIERREKWWSLMQEFGPDFPVPEYHRGDLLLSNSGLSKTDQNTILVATDNSTMWDVLKEKLIALHGSHNPSSHAYLGGRKADSWNAKHHRTGYYVSDADEQHHRTAGYTDDWDSSSWD